MTRLWLVDDSELARKATAAMLASVHDVEVFADGSIVIERASSVEPLPDVLLLDWHMPGVSGIEVLRFLRAAPRTVALPILVLTATGTDADLVEALESGADDYVSKDCGRAELVARVGSLLRIKELRVRAETAERELAGLLVSERAARADAESANHVKDDFLATLSHELRTPLNAIMGWVGLLQGGTLTPEVATRALATVDRNARAQAAIIEDLVDISRIVSGKLRLELKQLDIAEAVASSVETQRPSAAAKKIDLRVSITKGALIAGDESRVQQIVGNLISNAIRFTPAGGVVVVEVPQNLERVVVRVVDTGEGLSAELLPRIFDRFRQGDSTSTRAHAGLGLGLAIVRHLVELHDGTVTASSEGAGPGASFEVSLPRAVRAAIVPTGAPPSRIDPPVLVRLDHLTILVVDDDDDALALLAYALGLRGGRVSRASCAIDALAALDLGPHDVIVSDIMMPETDGYALMRSIRARGPGRSSDIPAIALTAAAREVDRSRALAAGFHLHMSKPVDIASLVIAIASLAQAAPAPKAA